MLISNYCQDIHASLAEVLTGTIQNESILMLALVIEVFVADSLRSHQSRYFFVRRLVKVEMNTAVLVQREDFERGIRHVLERKVFYFTFLQRQMTKDSSL